MKIILIVSLLTTLIFAQTLEEFAKKHNYETDYNVALNKAKKADKLIFFVMVTNYCPWCRKYEKRTLSDKNIDAEIHKHFIPLILNREKGNFPDQFKTPIVPVTYIVNYKDESIGTKEMGYKGKKDLREILSKYYATH